MSVERVRQPAPALWQYRVRDDNGQLHDIVIYGVPSVFPRGSWCSPIGGEGPPPLWLRMWGVKSWYEALVDGRWADPGGHAAYATHEDALDAAFDLIGLDHSTEDGGALVRVSLLITDADIVDTKLGPDALTGDESLGAMKADAAIAANKWAKGRGVEEIRVAVSVCHVSHLVFAYGGRRSVMNAAGPRRRSRVKPAACPSK